MPVASSVLSALALVAAAPATPDPQVLAYTLADKLAWTGDPATGAQMVKLWGDPAKPGPYAVLIRWLPGHMSRPHTHPYDRHVTVVSGTWWVGTGRTYDPDRTTPLPAGTVVTHFAGQPHYDGAKGEACVIEITGMGPAPTVPVG